MRSIESTTTASPSTSPELATMPPERLEREITELAAHVNAATCGWLLLVGEVDRRGVWAEWGCRSCADWLSYRCGVSPSTGRQQVRVARLLAELPRIRATFERGELCYSQVRALTRVATRETEQSLLELARYATAGQLEVVVRSYRGVLNYELDADGPERRYVRLERDDDGSLLIQARLPAEKGALVAAALEAGRDAVRRKPVVAIAPCGASRRSGSGGCRRLGSGRFPAGRQRWATATPEAFQLKRPILGTRPERMGLTATDRRAAERRRRRHWSRTRTRSS
jgi:hypothetical protein